MAKKIVLPTVLREDTHFYKAYEAQLKPYLGYYYISYSTASGVDKYMEDLIKRKFAKIKLPETCYTSLGGFLGKAVETGEFEKENPYGFIVDESLDISKYRPEGAEYEKLVIMPLFENVIFIGFIDVYYKNGEGAIVRDNKSGSWTKRSEYTSDEYTQLVLYAKALDENIDSIGVDFFERSGSHISPPLKLTGKTEDIPLEYSPERVKYAIEKLKKNTERISELYETYLKVFGGWIK